jgi:hypothetical protein
VVQGLHREDKLALYSHMYEVTYRPGEKIVRMGEMGRNFYLVTSVRSPLPRIRWSAMAGSHNVSELHR